MKKRLRVTEHKAWIARTTLQARMIIATGNTMRWFARFFLPLIMTMHLLVGRGSPEWTIAFAMLTMLVGLEGRIFQGLGKEALAIIDRERSRR